MKVQVFIRELKERITELTLIYVLVFEYDKFKSGYVRTINNSVLNAFSGVRPFTEDSFLEFQEELQKYILVHECNVESFFESDVKDIITEAMPEKFL